MCQVAECTAPPVVPYTLKQTSGFEFPAEVAVCAEHNAVLKGGAEFRMEGRDLYVGEGVRKSGKVYLHGVDSIRVESMVVTNRTDEEGYILCLKVRSAGEPEPHVMEIEASKSALADLREWLDADYLK